MNAWCWGASGPSCSWVRRSWPRRSRWHTGVWLESGLRTRTNHRFWKLDQQRLYTLWLQISTVGAQKPKVFGIGMVQSCFDHLKSEQFNQPTNYKNWRQLDWLKRKEYKVTNNRLWVVPIPHLELFLVTITLFSKAKNSWIC